MSSLKKRMADLITTRDLLKMARRVECTDSTCSGFYFSNDQECDSITCKRGQEIKRLEKELNKKLDQLD